MKIKIEIEVPDKLISNYIEESLREGKPSATAQSLIMQSLIHRVGMKLEPKLKAQFIKIITRGERSVTIINKKQ